MNRLVSWLALATSLGALLISTTLYLQADTRAEAAVRRREKALVERFAPQLHKITDDLGMKRPAKEPETLDELVEPLEKLFEGLAR